MSKRKCQGCGGRGTLWFADTFDRDNGKPCNLCNPAGLARDHGGQNGVIDVTDVPDDVSSLVARARYACGCVSKAYGNGHLKGRPTSVTTRCGKHGSPMASFSKTLRFGGSR